MYREQLIPCCPSGTPRLLDKDELAMENQQGAEAPDVEQSEHSAGGRNSSEVVIRCDAALQQQSEVLPCHRSRGYL